MKNNTLSGRYCFKNPRFKQIFRIMRISTFLLMVCVFCSYAGNAHSQNAKVSIRMNNVKLDKILNEIENQTDYLFIYNNQVDIKQYRLSAQNVGRRRTFTAERSIAQIRSEAGKTAPGASPVYRPG